MEVEEKNFQPLPGIEIPTIQPVAQRYTTELFHIWRVAANILNKQFLTADKVWSTRLGVGRGGNNSSPQEKACYKTLTQDLGTGRILWNDLDNGKRLALDRDQWCPLVNMVMNLRIP
jgi:hypothetical protein